MIKLIASTPVKQDGTSFYRAFGPLAHLSEIMDVEVIDYFSRPFTWADIKPVDIFFLHRPFREDLIQVVTYAKELGVKIWVDFDDNLFQLPPENSSYDNY